MTQQQAVTRGSLRNVQGPRWAFLMHHLINPAMRRLLSSRLHRLLGSSTLMVLEFRGRTSGTRYAFPIGYMQTGAEVVCYTPFRWWVNLRGGVPVVVTLHGRKRAGTADVCTDVTTVAAGMAVYLRHNPGDAMFWKVRLDAAKVPNQEDVERVARENVQIRITLADAG